ncbi:Guanine nucleotide-binding protein G(i) subunit alpha-2 [Globomyces sp. JEL0801]|nr:Guanine nucleotide-binding protein G(i) subunit alpha-2 [Globomyces sp. JEL0801]
MAENPEMNRMVDALNLFKEILQHKLLTRSCMLLLFNKKDLFEKKVCLVPIKDTFPDFPGEPKSAKAGGAYFEKQFRKHNEKLNKNITVHYTCCTDTKLVEKVATNLL